jgi:hypothetical protein
VSAAPRTLRAVALAAVLGCCCAAPSCALAASTQKARKRADAASIPARAGRSRRAPGGQPLTAAAGSSAAGTQETGGVAQAEGDPLVANGLGSPLCKGVLEAGRLPGSSARNCETSGFVAAAAPTADYGIDVHIDTGLLGLSRGGILSAVQDLFITPLWMAVVWVVHAVVVMLEWSFTIDLLDTAAAGIGHGLRSMQSHVTDPWLVIVFAVAAVLALYNGLIRRRVTESLGQAVLMLAMTLGGMWLIADPSGTIGALGRWANQASVGTLAVAAQGTPERGGGALAQSMGTVFAAVVEAPWCYLEFGDVAWCRSPDELDPQLHAAGLRIAGEEASRTSCGGGGLMPCAGSRTGLSTLHHSAELLRAARTNGAIFLALPANGPARNSINDEGSLLHAICRTSDATDCRGPAAAQAEFRTDGGTWSRVGGLLLIVVGVLGTVLLVGFITLRLLAAALFSLLYLLLAPGMVLAPALGEAGRAVFRSWAVRLLGAVVAKLVFAFLLGVVLAVLAILAGLQGLGWWTQWLLISAFTWGAYTRRHQVLGLAGSAFVRERRAPARSLAARANDLLESRKALFVGRWAKERFRRRESTAERRAAGSEDASRPAESPGEEQARRSLALERSDLAARAQAAPGLHAALSARRSQLQRLEAERAKALAGGHTRRAAVLEHRAMRVKAQVEHEQRELDEARAYSAAGYEGPPTRARQAADPLVRERADFLDRQAELPAASQRARRASSGAAAVRRDYAALASLVGFSRAEYERLDQKRQRIARVEIDRELALRKELAASARSPSEPSPVPARAGERGPAHEHERAARDGARESARPPTPARRRSSPMRFDRPRSDSPTSRVMHDAREVEARRKRQLGFDRD